jgi:hypothetical protein
MGYIGTMARSHRATTASASRANERVPWTTHVVDLTDPSGASWANPQVVLYHGTDAEAAPYILGQVSSPA